MLTITRGDSRTLQVTVYTDDAMATPENLTTVTAVRFTGRKASAAGAQVFQKTLAAGAVRITNAAQGALEIDLVPADTSSLPAAEARVAYDLELTWQDGQVTTVELGTMLVQPDVSY